VTFVVPLPLKVAGKLVDAVSVTEPLLPDPLIVQVAVMMLGGSPGDRLADDGEIEVHALTAPATDVANVKSDGVEVY
jgi:hypothetical protein